MTELGTASFFSSFCISKHKKILLIKRARVRKRKTAVLLPPISRQ